MCVAQFREFCKASSFKEKKNITKNDKVHYNRGSFYDNKREFYYVTNLKTLNNLAKLNNPYAMKGITKL